MKKDINTLYTNEIGIAFKWKDVPIIDKNKIQLVFRDTGFYIELKELVEFSKYIKQAMENSSDCPKLNTTNDHKFILLETPIKKLTFAVNRTELYLFNELVLGSIFQLELVNILNKKDINLS